MILSCNGGNKPFQKSGYAGDDIAKDAIILRDAKTKSVTLRIKTPEKWTLYAGTNIDNIDFSTFVAEGVGSGTFPIPLTDSLYHVFQLVTPYGKALLSSVHLPIEGGFNFRDLGGMATEQGQRVKWGKIIRSDDLINLTENDLTFLASIPLKSIVDFRSVTEAQTSSDKLPVSVVNHYALSIDPGNIAEMMKDSNMLSSLNAEETMTMLYKLFVSDSVCVARYREFFRILQDENNTPILYHCSAGKDRTGIATMLFLYSLGVSMEAVIQDYLLSNIYLADKYKNYMVAFPEMRAMFEVKPQYLASAFEEINRLYGSIDNFLENELQVNSHKMKEIYLQN
ncbi:MAG: tyrosine-protein phosphatase [Bacteroidales bacterium]|jgi:protein-tyrosine phosphatase|nr:tyrosine-protein phosphatase [Bacteroidales bacterium]